MEDNQFRHIIDLLIQIEQNTRGVDVLDRQVEPKIDGRIDRIQSIFFRRLEARTGWGRNDIKRAFIESIEESKLPIDEHPW